MCDNDLRSRHRVNHGRHHLSDTMADLPSPLMRLEIQPRTRLAPARWRPNAARVGGHSDAAAGTRLYAVALDLRGHCESAWADDEEYSVDAFAGDLAMVAATFSQPPVIIGASLGGIAALVRKAKRHPHSARGWLWSTLPPVSKSRVSSASWR